MDYTVNIHAVLTLEKVVWEDMAGLCVFVIQAPQVYDVATENGRKMG